MASQAAKEIEPMEKDALMAADQKDRENSKLTDRQMDAIAQLMWGHTLKETCLICRISDRTLRRWMNETDFLAEYNRQRRDYFDNVNGMIQSTTQAAARRLKDLIDSRNETTALKAIKIALQISPKSMEDTQLRQRLAELELKTAEQAAKIEKLEADNAYYHDSAIELESMKFKLKLGLFTCPEYVSETAWGHICNTKPDARTKSPNQTNNHTEQHLVPA